MNKLPLTIGISGHRDAVITEAHRKAIHNIFRGLIKRYPHSPLRLFSPLAVGADTEVAKIFLGLNTAVEQNLGLIVPIPYDLDYYEKTQFKTPEELEIFRDLLEESEGHIVLNRLSNEAKQELDNNIDANMDELNQYYREVGEFVADSSIVLMLLWENVDNHLEGGSANIATYKKTGFYNTMPSNRMFDNEGSLISITCYRAGKLTEGQVPPPVELNPNYLEQLLADKDISKALSKIDELNEKHESIAPEDITQSKEYLFPSKKPLSQSSNTLRDVYALMDINAITNQNKYYKTLNILFVLGFLTFVAFEFYKSFNAMPELFFLTAGILAFAYGVFRRSFRQKSHDKYLENRMLAEALRIQFFWSLRDIKEPCIKLEHRTHQNWIKHILLACYGLSYPRMQQASEQSASNKKTIECIKKYWIDNQKTFFLKNIKQIEKKEKRYSLSVSTSFILGLFILLGSFGVSIFYPNHPWLLFYLILIDSLVFGAFALIVAYYEKRGYEQIKIQYSLMHKVYQTASDKLTQAQALNQNQQLDHILRLTGEEALIENGRWYTIYKDKKPEVKGLG